MNDPLITDWNQAAGRLSGELPKGQRLPAASKVPTQLNTEVFRIKAGGFPADVAGSKPYCMEMKTKHY